MVLMISAVPVTGFAQGEIVEGIAFITGSSVRLRQEASTSSKILDTTNKDEVVVVLSKQGDWYKVIYDLQEGYMHGDYLKVYVTEDAELGYGKITGTSVNMRKGPDASSPRISLGKDGEKAYIIGVSNGWYRVIYKEDICYIRSDYLELTEVPYENQSSPNSPKFFRGGKSTGVEPSADALKGNTPDDMVFEDSLEDFSSNNIFSDGAKTGIGFTTGSGLRLRGAPSFDGTIIDSANKNEVVVVLGEYGEWYKVNYNLQIGFMHSDYLKISATEHAELGYGEVNTTKVNLRSGPGTNYDVVETASQRAKAYIIGIDNGWFRVIYGEHVCYIRSDLLNLTQIPYENEGAVSAPKFYRGGKSTGIKPSAAALKESSPTTGPIQSGNVTGEQIVEKAKQYLGTPYVYGGASPSGFDCSGFVYYVFRSLGINLSRTQTVMYAQGTPVSKSELKPGDLVFFQNTYKAGLSHVGIYVGNGQFIHSPSSGKVVSYADLNSDYYIEHYYGATRYTG